MSHDLGGHLKLHGQQTSDWVTVSYCLIFNYIAGGFHGLPLKQMKRNMVDGWRILLSLLLFIEHSKYGKLISQYSQWA